MYSKKLRIAKLLALTALLFAVLFFFGCKKKTDQTNTATPAASDVQAGQIVQTICPVMGNPIDKNVFVEYQGKKVYFCCSSCKAVFEKNPEKYLDKLPQFKDQAEQTMGKASDEMKKASEKMPDTE